MENDKEWSGVIGDLAADALVDAGLVDKSKLEQASEIIAEELLVRLCLNDRPNGDGEGAE